MIYIRNLLTKKKELFKTKTSPFPKKEVRKCP